MPTATDFVAAWLTGNRELLKLEELKLERSDLYGAKMVAWYETPQFLVEICAWDHACCLDVEVLEKSSDTFVFRVAGACEDEAGLAARLDSFQRWLTGTAGR